MSSKRGYTRLSLEEEHEQDREPQDIADAVTDSSAVGADVLPVATVEIDMGDSKQEFPIATGELVDESDIDVELPVAAAVFFIWVQIPGRPKPLRVDLPDGPQTPVSHVKAAIASASSHSYPPQLQRLAFNGRLLSSDTAEIQSYGIGCAGAAVHLFPLPASAQRTASSGGEEDHGLPVPELERPHATAHAGASGRSLIAHQVVRVLGFRLRIIAFIMMFFYGFGMVANMSYWMGDKSVADDREMVPGQAPTSLTTPIYCLDFVTNLTGIICASLAFKAVRRESALLARVYLRMTILLVVVSSIQLILEVQSLRERYQKGGTAPDSSGHTYTSDDLIYTVALNLVIRALFWTIIVRSGHHYTRALLYQRRMFRQRREMV